MVVAVEVLRAYALAVVLVIHAYGAGHRNDRLEPLDARRCRGIGHLGGIRKANHSHASARPVGLYLHVVRGIGEGMTTLLAGEPFHDRHERISLHHRAVALDTLGTKGAQACRLHHGKAAHEEVVVLVDPVFWLLKGRGQCQGRGGRSAARIAANKPRGIGITVA